MPIATATTVTVPTTTHLGSVQGSYINFASTQTLTSLTLFKNSNATWANWVMFDNEAYGFYVDGVNVTVSRYFTGDILEFSLSGSTAATVKIFNLGDASPTIATAVNSWSYEPATHITTLAIVDSNAFVTVDWNPPDDGGDGGGDGGGSTATPTPGPTATPTPSPGPSGEPVPSPMPTPDSANINPIGLIAVLAVIALIVCSIINEYNSKPSIKNARKKLRRQNGIPLKRPKRKKQKSWFGD